MTNPNRDDDRALMAILETAIDTHGLANVLRALSAVCHAKAEHLHSNWQDEHAARDWDAAGIQLDNASSRTAFTRLPQPPARSFHAL